MLATKLYMYMGLMSAPTQVSDPTSANCVTKQFVVTVNSAKFVQTCRFFLLGVSVVYSFCNFVQLSGANSAIVLGH